MTSLRRTAGNPRAPGGLPDQPEIPDRRERERSAEQHRGEGRVRGLGRVAQTDAGEPFGGERSRDVEHLNLRAEAREKLLRVRPVNLAQAGRISGITPADVALLMAHLDGMGK